MRRIVLVFLLLLAAFALGVVSTWVVVGNRAGLSPRGGPSAGSLIHKPSLEEYRTHYRDDPAYPLFSWWYSGFLSAPDGRVFMLRLSIFPPHSSHYPGAEIELAPLDFRDMGSTRETPGHKVSWPYAEVTFEETSSHVVATVPRKEGFRIEVTPDTHRIVGTTSAFSFALDLEGMDPAFFWNQGHPVAMPGSLNLMIGFEDFMSAQGTLEFLGERMSVQGDVVNERIFFDGDKWGWFQEDWLALTHPDFYCLLFQVRFRVDTTERDYKEGFLYLRDKHTYIPLTDLEVTHKRTGPGTIDGQMVQVPSEVSIRAANRELLLTGLFQSVGRSGREVALIGDTLIQFREFEKSYREVMAWDEVMRDGI